MSKDKEILDSITDKEYEHGFVTDVEQEFIPKGLNEDIIRLISAKKEEPEWMLEFRLNAFRRWQKMVLPTWAHLDIPEIDFQDIIYSAAPKKDEDRPKEIDPELEKTFDKLGIPLHERAALAGVAVMGFYKLKDKDVELMAKCNAGEITREEAESLLSRKY